MEETKKNYNEMSEKDKKQETPKPKAAEQKPAVETAVVTAHKLYLRKQPKRGEVVTILKKGDVLKVSASPKKDWVAAETTKGDKGFVMKEFLGAK